VNGERERLDDGVSEPDLRAVENDTAVQDLVETFQDSRSDVVGPVERGGCARPCSRTERIGGAVLDVNLQGELVFPVAEALQPRGMPFVFSTGYDGSTIPARFATVPRHEKPIYPAALIKAKFGQDSG
jgi:hypothetical protein